MAPTRAATVVGVYTVDGKDAQVTAKHLTPAAQALDKETNGALMKQLGLVKAPGDGEARTLIGLSDKHSLVAVANVGAADAGVDVQECRHEGRENVRKGIAAGVMALRGVGATDIAVDPCGHDDAAAEGANLCLFSYAEQKKEEQPPKPNVTALTGDATSWKRGVLFAECQSMARRFAEMPCNLLNPTLFAQEAKRLLTHCDVKAHDEAWAREKGMNSYLSVNAGSATPAVFLEVTVEPETPSTLPPLVLVGKGVCFDTGGISLKPSAKMDAMRADMQGAACVLATAHGASHMRAHLKRKLVVLTPLVENVPGPKATKPGDIVKAMNGKSIKIDNTDAEGRLILADALCYADEFKPATVIDVATLTGACMVALGPSAFACMTTDEKIWTGVAKASEKTGDRAWRMPVWKEYTARMAKCDYADLMNIGAAPWGGSSLAAAFLKEFTTCTSWGHLDIASVMEGDGALNYCAKGMTGRPTRTILEYVLNYDQ